MPKWAARLVVTFTTPLLSQKAVANLLNAAGQIAGIGDFRQEKGAGRFGSFRIVHPDDKEFASIVKTGGRKAQEKAMLLAPAPYNTETSELLGLVHCRSQAARL